MKNFTLLALLLCTFFSSCTREPNFFKTDVTSTAVPWTAPPAGRAAETFTFAIIGDLHSGEREGVFNVAVEQLNLLLPDFVLSVGDLIDGGTEDTIVLRKQFDDFDHRASRLKVPFFHVGGNHDLTNVIMRKFWERRYGRRYYHFLYKNALFLILDSEDYTDERMREIYEARAKAIEVLDGPNPSLARQMDYFKMPERVSGEIGKEQSAYFEKVLAQNPNVRWTFLLMHKPVWKRETEGNLSRIEAALAGRNYTVVNGHFHEYSHILRNNRDYIMVATTSGGQNPLSENAFDHITLFTVAGDQPLVANLRLDGILDKTGKIPFGGDSLCFQASRCRQN